ncbi:ElyC/SanA/YdcF family protein [Rheinheimera sp. WS51]|uniref:ElyC/SanA/YdcF family protein n=1 Tax=Rheinheimera sp. WS51 TaxID=3425886 RepID=UPI003D89C2CB
MKDILEPLLYPQNIVLFALFISCIFYRKKGLWCLFIFYYVLGNSFIANQVRALFPEFKLSEARVTKASSVNAVVLGCGGSATALPACAKSRLDRAVQLLPKQAASVVVTTRHCQPYVDYLLRNQPNIAINCFNGGDNTYQELSSLSQKYGIKANYIVTSQFHGWRVRQLVEYHKLPSQVVTTSSQTFRAVNCGINCFFTVNLSNFDLYSKLIAEFSSYTVFVATRSWTSWHQAPEAE